MTSSPLPLRPQPRRRRRSFLSSLLTTSTLASLSVLPLVNGFDFDWPSPSIQCGTNLLTWSGGQPPFKVVVAPLLQVPFVYEIPDSAYQNGQGSYPLQVQLTSGLRYVLFMMDATGIGSALSTAVTTVQGYGISDCLTPASQGANQTSLDFSFEVLADDIRQCQYSFNMSWVDGFNATWAPYNMTVLSLSKSFVPYDIYIGNVSAYDWQVNVPAGQLFTVMMNSEAGYGTGGVVGSYYVNASSGIDDSCLGASPTTTAVPAPTTSSDPGGGGGGSRPNKETPTIAAVTASIITVAAIAVIGGIIWWIRRRRRQRLTAQSSSYASKDSVDGTNGGARRMYEHPALLASLDHIESPPDHHRATYDSPVTSNSGMLPSPQGMVQEAAMGEEWTSSPISAPQGSHWQRSVSSGTDYSRNPFDTPDGNETMSLAMDRSGTPQRSLTMNSQMSSSSITGGIPPPIPTYTTGGSSSRSGPSRTKLEEEEADAIVMASYPLHSDDTPRSRASPYMQPVHMAAPGGFRITNAADGEVVPPTPAARAGTRRVRHGMEPQPRFVRHADAGRWETAGQEEEVIDLPPMYTEIIPEGRDIAEERTAGEGTSGPVVAGSNPTSPTEERRYDGR